MRKIWTPSIELPHILRQDERVDAARQALEKALADLSKAARECLFLPRLDELTGDVLDVLANQYHTDFFEPTMSDELKRFMIRDAIRFHRIKGTPQAVEEIVRKVYIDARVEEWFEYGGEPYFFRIKQDITDTGELTDRETLDRVRAIVRETKNARSWLEYFCFLLTFKDIVVPVDSHHWLLNQSYHDWYDYRADNKHYDGVIDYGNSPWHHNGRFSRNGKFNRRGWESTGRHGQRQATDFEVLRFLYTLEDIIDHIEPTDRMENKAGTARVREYIYLMYEENRLAFDYALFDELTATDALLPFFGDFINQSETIRAEETPITAIDYPNNELIEVGDELIYDNYHYAVDLISPTETHLFDATLPAADHVDVLDKFLIVYPIDTQETITVEETIIKPEKYGHRVDEQVDVDESWDGSADYTASEQGEPPNEIGNITVSQHITHNRRFKRNGSISHCGSLVSQQHFLASEEQTAWDNLREWLDRKFIEPCPQCGSQLYDFSYGSARVGSDVFIITDPQVLTVNVLCRQCGHLIAQYLVENEEWEAIL